MPNIEVFADVVCPFAYVGLTRLLDIRDQMDRGDVRFVVRSWPLELVNDKPVLGSFIGHEIEEIAPQIAPDLFTNFQVDSFPSSSLPSLALTSAGYANDEATGESIAMAVRRALFEQGQDVSDPAVLKAIADEHDIDMPKNTEPVLTEYESGKTKGVVGSPHFFVGENSLFCPVLDISKVDGHLRVSIDQPALDDMIELCFGN